ncbi:MAG: complex I NDUFA9 subunit family protein [Betaproteobacteria bacterium]
MIIRRVCLVGGSGFLGRNVAMQLAARGITVRIPTRHRERAKRELILLPTAEVLNADVHEDGALAQSVRGCDAVVNLVGVLHDAGGQGYARNHEQLPTRIVRTCLAEAVPRLVHVSALGAGPGAPSNYQRSKGRGEAAVKAGAREGLAVTILRPSVIFGRGDGFLTLFARLARAFPVLPLGCAGARFQPIWVEDVARAAVHCVNDPATAGNSYDLCGPTTYTLADLVQLTCATIGLRRTILPLPPRLARLQAALLERLPGRLMTLDNVRSMSVDNVCGCGFPEVFGFRPTALEAVAPSYLTGASRLARHDLMRGRAGR